MPTLDWIGKKAVLGHHRTVPYRLLRREPKLSCGDPDSGNLLVEGDNLEALKSLLPHYAGRVKCIYIDPPYNTGEEKWTYNDNVNSPQIRSWLGHVVGPQAEDLTRHDKWLCMMYPRLVLLKQFLRKDGTIWVSIDDSEVTLLRCLMDEIFGRDRFVACNVWQKRYSRENRAAIGDVHEYIVVYAMDPKAFKLVRNKIPITGQQAKVYRNPNSDPRGRWRPIPMTAQAGHATDDQFYEIEAPSGRVFRPPEGRCWGLSRTTFEQLRADGRIWFGKKGNSQPNVIRYLYEVEGMVPWTWWPHDEVGNTDESKKELYDILGREVAFDTPKPLRLVERILQIATSPGDLVLDSFAGSGTTGHAILRLNAAQPDMPERHFIVIEMEAEIARTVTAIRLSRAAGGYERTGEKGSAPALGGGYTYCRLEEPLLDSEGAISPSVRFADLARHVFFTETGQPVTARGAAASSPLVGISNGIAYYLLFNGVLGDKRPDGGNVLTSKVLASLPPHDGPRVVFGEGCRLGMARLKSESVTFKQIPYQIKTSSC